MTEAIDCLSYPSRTQQKLRFSRSLQMQFRGGEKKSLEADDIHLLGMKDGEIADTSHQRHPAAMLK